MSKSGAFFVEMDVHKEIGDNEILVFVNKKDISVPVFYQVYLNQGDWSNENAP
jgi:hypothetical protein